MLWQFNKILEKLYHPKLKMVVFAKFGKGFGQKLLTWRTDLLGMSLQWTGEVIKTSDFEKPALLDVNMRAAFANL